ncbi:MAG: YceI family protein [Oligoflexia bacterium]|nr:YceI family protein [Oligoflexia bacterium]
MTTKLNTWELDPAHSSANFSVKHMMIAKVHGGFKSVKGKMQFDRNDLAHSSIEATIDASSIDTREPKRDEHLKSADFFDVQKYPALTFKSKRIEEADEDRFKVAGDLTIRGVTREVVLDVESSLDEIKDPYGNVKIGASAATRIKRKDFGLNWNAALEAGGVLVGDDITINLDLQFMKKAI